MTARQAMLEAALKLPTRGDDAAWSEYWRRHGIARADVLTNLSTVHNLTDTRITAATSRLGEVALAVGFELGRASCDPSFGLVARPTNQPEGK